jgi:hypothetical protein
VEFLNCTMAAKGQKQKLPDAQPFPGAGPVADFQIPERIQAGQPATFRCTSKGEQASGDAAAPDGIVDRLWDFGHGIPAVAAEAVVTFEKPGPQRVTLVVWDGAGRGSRIEKQVTVEP